MQSLDRAAQVICSVNLDKDSLGWSNDEFYPVYFWGRRWRSMRQCIDSNAGKDCDLNEVAEKIQIFLSKYEGSLKDEVEQQLTKLAHQLSIKGRVFVKLPTFSDFEANMRQQLNKLSISVKKELEQLNTKSPQQIQSLEIDHGPVSEEELEILKTSMQTQLEQLDTKSSQQIQSLEIDYGPVLEEEFKEKMKTELQEIGNTLEEELVDLNNKLYHSSSGEIKPQSIIDKEIKEKIDKNFEELQGKVLSIKSQMEHRKKLEILKTRVEKELKQLNTESPQQKHVFSLEVDYGLVSKEEFEEKMKTELEGIKNKLKDELADLNNKLSLSPTEKEIRKIHFDDLENKVLDIKRQMADREIFVSLKKSKEEMLLKDDGEVKLIKPSLNFIEKQPVRDSNRLDQKEISVETPSFEGSLFRLHDQTEQPEIRSSYLPYLNLENESFRCGWIHCPAKTWIDLKLEPRMHINTVSLGKGVNVLATIYPKNRAVFWQMMLLKGNVVVDLTNLNDLIRNKVPVYYPEEKGEIKQYGNLVVTCLKKEVHNPIMTTYRLNVENSATKENKEVDRVHYSGWEDVQGTDESEILDFVKILEFYLPQSNVSVDVPVGVPVFHCMGGVGRTGTALVAIALKRLIEQGSVTCDTLLDNIESLILEGRKQRGPEFVQVMEQIASLWKFGMTLIDQQKKG